MQKNVFTFGDNEFHVEVEEEGIKIRGRIDHIDDNCIWELKTVKNLYYYIEKPDSNHVKQIMIYLHAFKRDKGRIVYIEKNTLQIIEHEINYDNNIFKDIMAQFTEVHKCLVEKKLPEKLKDYPNNFKCQVCDFKEKCGKDENIE